MEALDCVFSNNAAGNHAGAIYNGTRDLFVQGCEFFDNSAVGSTAAGAVYSEAATSNHFADCTFTGNRVHTHADALGGAVVIRNSDDSVFSDCTFTANSNATDNGGAMYLVDIDRLWLTDCTYTGNRSELSGGAIWCRAGQVTATGCTFSDNVAESLYGGAMYEDGRGTLNFSQCTFTGNTAEEDGGALCLTGVAGGAIHFDGGGSTRTLRVDKSTFYDNSAVYGGSVSVYEGMAYVRSTIHWQNAATVAGPDWYLASSLDIAYSCLNTNLVAGTGTKIFSANIHADPLFVDAPNGNFRLKTKVIHGEHSPCIDKGNPNDNDWSLEPEPHGGRVNMGRHAGTSEAALSWNPAQGVLIRFR